MLTASCSGKEPVPGASPGRPTGSSAGASVFPVTIDHTYGDTTIESQPTRVVTVGLTDQDAVLALGVAPVGTGEWFGAQPGAIWPWARDELEAIAGAEVPEIVKGADGISFEKIAGLRPDLILAVFGGLTRSDYDKLSEIAPTVAQPDGVDYGVAWDDQIRIIGQALGHADAAEQSVAHVDEQIAAERAAHPEFDGATGVVATVFDGKLSVYSPLDMRGWVLRSLGFEVPPEVAAVAGDSFSADVSMERVDLVDGDLVVWLLNDTDTDVPKFEAEPLDADLDVHRQGRDVFVEMLRPEGAASTFITPLRSPFLLDELVPELAAAVDGDPDPTAP